MFGIFNSARSRSWTSGELSCGGRTSVERILLLRSSWQVALEKRLLFGIEIKMDGGDGDSHQLARSGRLQLVRTPAGSIWSSSLPSVCPLTLALTMTRCRLAAGVLSDPQNLSFRLIESICKPVAETPNWSRLLAARGEWHFCCLAPISLGFV